MTDSTIPQVATTVVALTVTLRKLGDAVKAYAEAESPEVREQRRAEIDRALDAFQEQTSVVRATVATLP